MGIRGTVIAGVLSTLISSFLLWAFGLFNTFWVWLSHLTTSTWSVISYDVTLPIGILVPACIVLLYFIISNFLRKLSHKATVKPDIYSQKPNLAFSDNELNVIRVLVAFDGDWVNFEEISRKTRLSKLHVEQAVERLLNKDFIKNTYNYLDGASFRLSSIGRDYVIEQGMVFSQ